MPKTPRLTSKQVIKLLKENGFILDHVSGSHYVFYHPVDGRRAVVPYHTKDLPIGTLKAILRLAGLE
ncbi:MAG: type II toxin-antitoxin system HicA family toxin [Candidatus Magasanikbacteria bacterium]|nr:type II toxin-antitoxin system HicA family toxin [Candidatus Magasanikbacteria bacterium]